MEREEGWSKAPRIGLELMRWDRLGAGGGDAEGGLMTRRWIFTVQCLWSPYGTHVEARSGTQTRCFALEIQIWDSWANRWHLNSRDWMSSSRQKV